jgi:hypothetical protein
VSTCTKITKTPDAKLVASSERMNELTVQQDMRFANLGESPQELMGKLCESRRAFSRELESQTVALTKLQRDEHGKTRSAINQVIQDTRDLVVGSGLAIPKNGVDDAIPSAEIVVC